MTRGKHGVQAAARREQNSYETEVESYRRTVAKRSAELSELRAELADMRASHAREIHTLNARLKDGASIELEATKIELDELRTELGEVRTASKRVQKNWETLTVGLRKHFESEGLTHIEAIEKCLELLGKPITFVPDGNEIHAKDASRIRAIQRARGQRR